MNIIHQAFLNNIGYIELDQFEIDDCLKPIYFIPVIIFLNSNQIPIQITVTDDNHQALMNAKDIGVRLPDNDFTREVIANFDLCSLEIWLDVATEEVTSYTGYINLLVEPESGVIKSVEVMYEGQGIGVDSYGGRVYFSNYSSIYDR